MVSRGVFSKQLAGASTYTGRTATRKARSCSPRAAADVGSRSGTFPTSLFSVSRTSGIAVLLALSLAGSAAAATLEDVRPTVRYVISGGIAGDMLAVVMQVNPDGSVSAGGETVFELDAREHQRFLDSVQRLAAAGLRVQNCPDCYAHTVHVRDDAVTVASGPSAHVRRSDPPRAQAYAALYTVLDLAADLPPRANQPSSACARSIQDRVAWDHDGDTDWPAARLSTLCYGAADSEAPGDCFATLMAGNVDWGGGTRWNPNNALDLCAGTRDADRTIACFRDAIERGNGWRRAIDTCRVPQLPEEAN